MKQKLTSLDLKIIASELRSTVVGYRLQNIYNVLNSSRIFSLKFSKPDSKWNLLVDYGFKLYLSEFERRLEPAPSNFVVKLRKHLKSKRLTNLKQIGDDRIIVLEFSNGLYYLVLEFFSAGNVILLNADQEILVLQRLVQENENNSKYAVREKYQMFDRQLFNDSVKDEEEARDVAKIKYQRKSYCEGDILLWYEASKKAPKKKELSLLKFLFLNCTYLTSELILRNLKAEGINPTEGSSVVASDLVVVEAAVRALNKSEIEVTDLVNSDKTITGYILLKKNPLHSSEDKNLESSLLGDQEGLSMEFSYESFSPFPIVPESADSKVIEFEGYNKTLDKFFSSLDLLKNAMKIQQSKALLDKKLNNVRRENLHKIDTLNALELENYHKAELIIRNADKIEQAKLAVQTLVDQGMDWKNIEALIEAEQSRGNETAQMIVLPLLLKDNTIKVKLAEEEDIEDITESDENDEFADFLSSDEEDDEVKSKKPEAQQKHVIVKIDLSISAWANSKTYFDQKKSMQIKKEKTEKTAEIALKSSERKINATLKKDIERSNKDLSIRKVRPKNWFEKFYWFISSEGYLVIAAKDNLQLEMIYYKYFNSTNDYYVCSEIDGSLKVFVKNPLKDQPVPPSTLAQAGIFALSSSKAWSSKIVTPAWFVQGSKISKLDQDGTLLPDGMLNIIGEKNFLPPSHLSMGVGFVWLMDEQSTKVTREKRWEKTDYEVVDSIADIKESAKARLTSLSHQIDNLLVTESDEQQEPEPAAVVEKPAVKNVRGKKGKQKKINQKYKDQDEEEKIARLKVLGGLKQSEEEPKPEPEVNKRSNNIVKQQKKYNEQFIDILEEELHPANYLEILDEFSVKVLSPSEIIEEVIPMFGPWQAFAKYKYKVKIEPGTNKVGKSMTEALHYFSTRKVNKVKNEDEADFDLDFEREHQIIQQLKPADLQPSFTVKGLRVMLPSSNKPKASKPKKGKKK